MARRWRWPPRIRADSGARVRAAGPPVRVARRHGCGAPRPRGEPVQHQRFAQHGTHRHAWVERGVGVLKDDLHAPPLGAHLRVGQGEQVLPFEAHAAAGRFEETQNQSSDRRLAAARFAHDGKCLAGIEMEVDTVDGADMARQAPEGALPDRKVLGETLHLEQRSTHAATCESGARRHRLRWPGATSISCGGAARHSGSTKGHRAAKRQPAGGRVISGTRPSIEGSRSRLSSSRGIEPSRPTV